MITENLSTLKIHKLTQAQYDRELAAGNIDANALYLTPDEAKDAESLISTHNTATDAHADIREAINKVLTGETDPTVPDWAKEPNKPTYTASEVGLGNVDNVKQYSAENPPPYPVTSVNGETGAVSLTADKIGALSNTTKIPSKISDLTNDSGFITGYTETDPTVPSWAKASIKPSYTADEIKAISYEGQTLTEKQKAQARANIGAVKIEQVLYTNILPLTTSPDGSIYNEIGYKTNTRISVSSGDFVEKTLQGHCTSGLIPANAGDIIRLKNCTFMASSTTTENQAGIYGANADGSYSGYMTSMTDIINSGSPYGPVYDIDSDNIIQFTVTSNLGSSEYFRLVVQEFNENSIITINEEIYENKLEEKVGNLKERVAELEEELDFLSGKDPLSCTNVLPLSINSDGTLYNNGKGYKKNYRITSNYGEDVHSGYCITGFIPIKPNDIIRFKNLDYMPMDYTAANDGESKICVYNEDFSSITYVTHTPESPPSELWSPVYREDGNVEQLTMPIALGSSLRYMRICAKNIDENSIITINEEISYTFEKRVTGLEERVESLEDKDISTPIKGVDYWTEDDKAEIVANVIAALPVYNGEVV